MSVVLTDQSRRTIVAEAGATDGSPRALDRVARDNGMLLAELRQLLEEPAPAKAPARKRGQTVTHLPVAHLTSHPGNVRQDLGDLTEMARSVREHGLLQPLMVTEHPKHVDRYVVLDGHRRLGACVLAKVTTVPAIIRHHVEDRDQIVLMLVADVHRLDLDPIERAEAYDVLRNQGLSLKEIARQVSTTPSNVSRSLALLELDEESRASVRQGRLPVMTAIDLVRGVRQEQRREGGDPVMGRPKGIPMAWFSGRHRLARVVREICTHQDRPVVGGIGCGVCWERAIREEAPAEFAAAAAAAAAAADANPADEAVVRRILNGDYRLGANRAERIRVTEAWIQLGRNTAELGRLTGWKPERYARVDQVKREDIAS